MNNEYYTIKEAADILGVAVNTIRRAILKDKLKSYGKDVGCVLVKKADIDQMNKIKEL